MPCFSFKDTFVHPYYKNVFQGHTRDRNLLLGPWANFIKPVLWWALILK